MSAHNPTALAPLCPVCGQEAPDHDPACDRAPIVRSIAGWRADGCAICGATGNQCTFSTGCDCWRGRACSGTQAARQAVAELRAEDDAYGVSADEIYARAASILGAYGVAFFGHFGRNNPLAPADWPILRRRLRSAWRAALTLADHRPEKDEG